MSKYPHFTEALRKLAPTDAERARVMGVSVRSLQMYLAGDALPRVEKIKRLPCLDDALTHDFRPKSVVENAQLPA